MTVTSKTLAHAGDYMSSITDTGVILQYSDVDKPQDGWLVSDKIPPYDEWIGRCMSAPERRWLKMEQIVIENLPIRSKDSSYGVGLGEKPPSTTRAREQGGKNARRTQAPELSEGAKRLIQTLEASLGRPRNRNITIGDLDSMLADYVDEEEDSVELVRSVRDNP